MSRPSRQSAVLSSRDRLKLEFTRAAPLRDLYPQLAQVRVELEFDDGTPRRPSPQAYSYFPSAQGFFRYACPCHTCNGEFDLSAHVAELAQQSGRSQRTRKMNFSCSGQRAQDAEANASCPISAQVRVSTVPHTKEQSA